MKNHSPLSLALLLSLLVTITAGCASRSLDKAIAGGAVPLSQEELVTLLAGSTIRMDEYNTHGILKLQENGSVQGTSQEGLKTDGRWGVEDNRLCLQFDRWGYGEKHCYQMLKNGSRYSLFRQNGLRSGSIQVIGRGSGKRTFRAATSPPAADNPDLPENREASSAAPQPESHRYEATDTRFILSRMARNCPGCNLDGAQLAAVDLTGAYLAGASLIRANLAGAVLRRAILTGADLSNANLAGADLSGANLAGTNLSNANLVATDFTGADLSGAIGLKRK